MDIIEEICRALFDTEAKCAAFISPGWLFMDPEKRPKPMKWDDLDENTKVIRRGFVRAALAAALEKGWVLVPKEPDAAMTKAAIEADDKRTGAETCKHIYRAMLSRSPEVK